MKKVSLSASLFSKMFMASCGVGAFCLPMSHGALHAAFEALPKSLSKVRSLPKQPMLKVLLGQDQDGFMVEVKGAHNVYDPYTGKKLESAFLKSSYYMIPTSDGVKWGQEFPGIYQLLIIPDSSSTSITVNGIQYPGAVAFYQVESKLAAINWVSLEDFTSSILSTTLFPKDQDQKETLATYAIAIRTLAYQSLIESHNAFWDVKASEAGYKGKAVERSDKTFLDAMKVSQDIILAQSGNATDASQRETLSQSFTQTFQHMPFQDVHNMAESGKDARQILEHYYPGRVLTLAEPPKMPQGHHYSR